MMANGGPYLLLLAATGLLVAWGIRKQYAYVQSIGAIIVIGTAMVGVVHILQAHVVTSEIVSIAAGAFATAKCLFRDEEAREYYARLRAR